MGEVKFHFLRYFFPSTFLHGEFLKGFPFLLYRGHHLSREKQLAICLWSRFPGSSQGRGQELAGRHPDFGFGSRASQPSIDRAKSYFITSS
jgi:hypothetical protein